MYDPFREHLNVEVVEVSRGYAKVKGKVEKEYLNFHGTAHGSYIFALADFAFALAANSDEYKRMAVSVRLDFYKPAYEGDELLAEARVVHGRKIIFCELTVFKEGETIAKGEAIAYGQALEAEKVEKRTEE